MEQFIATVVGNNFRPKEAKDVMDSLVVGEEVVLEPEPDNAYDANAVKVLADDEDGEQHHIGYIERTANAELAEWLNNGGAVTAVICGWASTRKPHVEITPLVDEPTAA